MKAKDNLIRFDWFIKKMIRDKSDFKVLEGFLTALLKKDIKIVNILESESNQRDENQKYNRVDLLTETEDGEKIIIEIQNEREADYLERLLFGTSKVIVDYQQLGSEYKNISKVISVSILYFNLGSSKDYIYYGSTEFAGVNTYEKLIVKNKIKIVDKDGNEEIKFTEKKNIFPEYYLINVEKFKNVVKTDIDEWIYMLKNTEIKEEFKSKNINEAKEKLNMAKLSDAERKSYERHIENIVIEKDMIDTATVEGMYEGIIKGKIEGKIDGLKEGLIKGLINTAEILNDMGIPRDKIFEQLTAKYKISKPELEQILGK